MDKILLVSKNAAPNTAISPRNVRLYQEWVVAIDPEMRALPVGKGELRREGKRVAILAFGTMLSPALVAGETLDATVANMRFIKPMDSELVLRLARAHELLVTVEENTIQGGAGSAVEELLQQHGVMIPLLQLGLPDRFVEQGDPARMLADCGLDANGLIVNIKNKLP